MLGIGISFPFWLLSEGVGANAWTNAFVNVDNDQCGVEGEIRYPAMPLTCGVKRVCWMQGLDVAKLNLEFTKARTPIAGGERVGRNR